MNSKQLFHSVCHYKNTDRALVDYLAHPVTDNRLRAHLKCQRENELLDMLESIFFYLLGRDISQNEGFMPCYKGTHASMSHWRMCPLGITWTRGDYDSKFAINEAIGNSLKNIQNERDVLNHPWPKKADFDFSSFAQFCDTHTGRVNIGGLWTGIMGDSYRLCGFENFLLNSALNPNLVKCLVNRMSDMYLELNDLYFTQLKGKFDIWFFGNDFGSQDGLLLSPDMWHELFFENIKKLTNLAHTYDLKIMMHSCGGIAEQIDSLIEAGVDILDPIQVTAKGMQPATLAARFGGKIIFYGGINAQQVLPFGMPDKIRKHAASVTDAFSGCGGYIFAPSQILGPDIPVENIVAMYSTVNIHF